MEFHNIIIQDATLTLPSKSKWKQTSVIRGIRLCIYNWGIFMPAIHIVINYDLWPLSITLIFELQPRQAGLLPILTSNWLTFELLIWFMLRTHCLSEIRPTAWMSRIIVSTDLWPRSVTLTLNLSFWTGSCMWHKVSFGPTFVQSNFEILLSKAKLQPAQAKVLHNDSWTKWRLYAPLKFFWEHKNKNIVRSKWLV